jgi:hypothetical protein
MTEAEAIKFLQKCERYLLGARNLNPDQVIAKSRNNCFPLMSLGFVDAFLSLMGFHHDKFGGFFFYFRILTLVLGLFLIGLGSLLLIRLRVASRALNQAPVGSSRLSGSR